MTTRNIFLTEFDYGRLAALVAARKKGGTKATADGLEKAMREAAVVDPQHIPANYVTMNSTVRFADLADGEVLEYTLVFPAEADVAAGKVSVLSPIGAALLGRAAGDEVEYATPGGVRKLRVVAVVDQPEARQVYDL